MQRVVATQVSREVRLSARDTSVTVSLRIDEAGPSWHNGRLIDYGGEARVSAHDGARHLFFIVARGGSTRLLFRLFCRFDEQTATTALSLARAALGELLPESVFLKELRVVQPSVLAEASRDEREVQLVAPEGETDGPALALMGDAAAALEERCKATHDEVLGRVKKGLGLDVV